MVELLKNEWSERTTLRKRTVNQIIRKVEQWQNPGKSTPGRGNNKIKGSEAGPKKCIHLESCANINKEENSSTEGEAHQIETAL